jgi:hypothetical protein
MGAVFLDQVIPIIERGPAEPAGRRSDLLERRHDVLLDLHGAADRTDS